MFGQEWLGHQLVNRTGSAENKVVVDPGAKTCMALLSAGNPRRSYDAVNHLRARGCHGKK